MNFQHAKEAYSKTKRKKNGYFRLINQKTGLVKILKHYKNGIVHGGIGTADFDEKDLEQNLVALMSDLVKAKPSTAKGIYIKKVTVSSTMGPGLTIDQSSLGI